MFLDLWPSRNPGGAVVKNLPASARDSGNAGSIPGLGKRSPGRGPATHSSMLAWEIPWIEETGWLQSMGLQRAGHDRAHTEAEEMAWAKIRRGECWLSAPANWGVAGDEAGHSQIPQPQAGESGLSPLCSTKVTWAAGGEGLRGSRTWLP